jgi:hypothetical protein
MTIILMVPDEHNIMMQSMKERDRRTIDFDFDVDGG